MRCYRWAFIAALLASASLSHAGPVNSAGSYPFASISARGDRLLLGDTKGHISWQLAGVRREQAIRWSAPIDRKQRVSGGLASAEQLLPAQPAAIACAERETWLYDAKRSSAAPAGTWILSSPPQAGSRLCAMLANGHYAEFFPQQARLRIDGRQQIELADMGPQTELLAAGDSFLLLNPEGWARSLVQAQGVWRPSAAFAHGLGSFAETTRFAGNARFLLMADPSANYLAQLEKTADGLRIHSKARLPVNPCEDEQVCGLSLAEDDTWVLSGYWGHYLGFGQTFMRLNIPLSVEKGVGAVAFAHSGNQGSFVYLGWDDGDLGTLPRLALTKATAAAELPFDQRWMIWRKPGATQQNGLAKFRLAQSIFSQSQRVLSMEIHQGPLPAAMPRDWIAWEPNQSWRMPALPSSPSALSGAAWWSASLGLKAAHELTKQQGIKPQVVHAAVIDSGIDSQHPLLQEQLDRKPGELAGNGIDDDDNGFVDDVFGYDFVEEDSLPNDEFGHGTHVAGLMMAGAGTELLAPAPNLRLTVVRALDRNGKSNSIDLARALLYVAAGPAEILNCSWGGGPDTQALRDAFALLAERGVRVFSSAGNDSIDTDQEPEVPKSYPAVTAIAALGLKQNLASFSNFGRRSVRFLAPGESIISTVPEGKFAEKSGTSMASPLAAASYAYLLGSLRAWHSGLSPAETRLKADQLLCQSAERRGVETASQCGRLQLDRAVQALLSQRRR